MHSIGRYKVEGVITESGLSIVYAALDPIEGRRVAIKVAKPSADSSEHAWIMERFRQEGSLLAQLKHPAITPICDQGVLPDGSPYLVTGWVEGTTLEEVLATRITIPLLGALYMRNN